jgi:nickel-dependent lactate racemase
MQAGIPFSQAVSQVPMRRQDGNPIEKYDLVIASAGGSPKDINFYQAQKALTHAALFTRIGGVILLAAECEEGVGSAGYVEFMRGLQTNAQVFERFREQGFRVGPHKGFQVARIAQNAKIVLLSKMLAEVTAGLLMTPAMKMDEAVHLALQHLSPGTSQNIRAAVLPRATNTIPGF